MPEGKERVLEAFKKAGKPLRPGDVVKITGLSREEVSRIIAELKKEGKLVIPKRCYYALAEK